MNFVHQLLSDIIYIQLGQIWHLAFSSSKFNKYILLANMFPMCPVH